MKQVDIYTDGACSGNPGPGGWGVVLKYGDVVKELSGGDFITTNNKMEMTAVIKGLSALKEPCDVNLYTDSQYIVNSINKNWIWDWQKRGWKKSNNEQVKNIDLWKQILELMDIHNVTFIWVKGHNGHPENERCDGLATSQRNLFSNK